MDRRSLILAAGAALLAGCETTPVSGPAPVKKSAPAAASKDVPATGVASMKIVDVDVVLKPGMGRPFQYAGIPPARAHSLLASKAKAALNRANPSGKTATRAVIDLRAIVIAEKVKRRPHYDSTVYAVARFYDVATGTQIGEETALGIQSTYRPGFLGGYDRVLTPEEELALITTHSTDVLAQRVFG